MAFDWPHFLDARRIPYATSGPNVSKGNIATRCPFCGAGDTSEHMSISLAGNGWRCWRKHEHRGRSPVRLIAALTGMTMDQAKAIAGVRTILPGDFAERVRASLTPQTASAEPPELAMPKEFQRFRKSSITARPYISHMLETRRIPARVFWDLAERLDLRYCTQGPFRGRIIFPVRYKGKLVSWTGRTIGDDPVRYRACEDGAKITDFLLWYDELRSAPADVDTVYLTEGPFDALKVWALGEPYGIVSTCFFTSSPSTSQVDFMHDVLPGFKHRFLMLDADTLSTAMRVQMQTHLGITIKQLPRGVKDPDELQDAKVLFP